MEVTIKKTRDGAAEFEVPEGCVLCGSDISVRVGPGGAYTVCANCRWISRALVDMKPNGLEVAYPAAGQA